MRSLFRKNLPVGLTIFVFLTGCFLTGCSVNRGADSTKIGRPLNNRSLSANKDSCSISSRLTSDKSAVPFEQLAPPKQRVRPAERFDRDRLGIDTSTSLDQQSDQSSDIELVDVVVATADQVAQAEPASPVKMDSDLINLMSVIDSIHSSFPLLDAAYRQNQIAQGHETAAWGSFDAKLQALSGNTPLGYYETYRNQMNLRQPLFSGGEVFGGYRVGRGSYEPWYRERQTNDAGEIAAGINVPLMRDRKIDARRAELWRASYDRQIADPEIRIQLLQFVKDGSIAYWDWVKAGQKLKIGEEALRLATSRNAQVKRMVELGDLDPPALEDNQRAIAQRQSKLIGLRQLHKASAIRLSLYLRTPSGDPLIPQSSPILTFPEPQLLSSMDLMADIDSALVNRPEIQVLDTMHRRLEIDLSEARNEFLPKVDAQLIGSQDLGEPTSGKRDKSELELEARLVFDMPIQRRKAQGKTQAVLGKIAQVELKKRFLEDKIRTEIGVADAALRAASDRFDQATESKRLAESLAGIERRKLEVGEADLFDVTLRERIAIEAANEQVDASFDYFVAMAVYDAAMALDRPRMRVPAGSQSLDPSDESDPNPSIVK